MSLKPPKKFVSRYAAYNGFFTKKSDELFKLVSLEPSQGLLGV